jgi:hypothetical protein
MPRGWAISTAARVSRTFSSKGGAVDHHRVEAALHGLANRFKFSGVIHVQDHGNVVVRGHRADQARHIDPTVAGQVRFETHQDHRGAMGLGCFQDRAYHHVFHAIESGDRVVVCAGMAQNFRESGKHGFLFKVLTKLVVQASRLRELQPRRPHHKRFS